MKNVTKAIANATNKARHFIIGLRTSLERGGGDPVDFGMMFSSREGGFALTPQEAAEYRACIDAIVAVYGSRPDARPLSERTAEHLLRTATTRSLRPRRHIASDPRIKFLRRLAVEMRSLRKAFAKSPDIWAVNIKIHGIAERLLPLQFGTVTFQRGTKGLASRIALSCHAFSPKKRVGKARIADENAVRDKLRAELRGLFSDGVVATASVEAFDNTAALRIATERVRQAVDIINFFAVCFDWPRSIIRAFVPPEGERQGLTWHAENGNAMAYLKDSRATRPVFKFSVRSRRAKKFGAGRAHDLLSASKRTPFQERLTPVLV